FLLLFYYNTHWPYLHPPACALYQPEVPADFDFTTWNLLDYREGIENRYRNALGEFDAWLQDILKGIDLENTIVVVTGDHGEEMFETGRLGHASTLNEAQTHTPCLIHVPGVEGRRHTFI